MEMEMERWGETTQSESNQRHAALEEIHVPVRPPSRECPLTLRRAIDPSRRSGERERGSGLTQSRWAARLGDNFPGCPSCCWSTGCRQREGGREIESDRLQSEE
ncbi:hypothetical protein AAFF_G00206000 [Aldrovandia affinis]|uniref:Uncharacterized protein n=1 Tax=Aldrovandia affinis TaxID=143900 RepID=A0AAD7RHS9_9TELE|nr:hypothetical protein AAFF_G00206000 [Aldrovandia affinis]